MKKNYTLLLVSVLLVILSISCTEGTKKEDKKTDKFATMSGELSGDTIKKSGEIGEKVSKPVIKKDTITVIGVGDMMLGTHYPKSPNYLPPNNDYNSLLAPVVDVLRDADITFGNCEGTFSDDISTAKACNDPRWCYRFCMPEDYVNGFVNAGFDVVSIGNNHMGDLGNYGRKRTQKVLKDAGIHYAGLVGCPKDTFTVNGVKYGFCAFAPNEGTCQITDYKFLTKTVKELKSECQIVIVSFHGGAEGSKHEHVTKNYEHFLGQNRGNVYEFAHTAVDAGADIVFGQGPHVTRAIEMYKGRFIAYSLGNFCTYRRFNIKGVSGLAPIVKVFVNEKGEFLKGEITPIYQDKFKGTKLDTQKRIIKRMQELVAQDFPDSKLEIKSDGEIVIK